MELIDYCTDIRWAEKAKVVVATEREEDRQEGEEGVADEVEVAVVDLKEEVITDSLIRMTNMTLAENSAGMFSLFFTLLAL